MWLGFTFCWGECVVRGDRALNSRSQLSFASSRCSRSDIAYRCESFSHLGNPLIHGPEFLSVYLSLNVHIISVTE